MIHIAICDNDSADLKRLRLAVRRVMDNYFIPYDIEEHNSGHKLLGSSKTFDLVFLDIILDGENGIEVGKLLYRKNHYTKIIFQTNLIDYCQDAVNKTHAFAVLEKPVSVNLLEEQINEFLISINKLHRTYIEFKNVRYVSGGIELEKEMLTLPADDIIYFEYLKSKKKIEIVMGSQKYIYSETMRELEKRMHPLGFNTSRRGLLVNVKKIRKIKGYTILMSNGEELPLSQKRVSEFKERMNSFIHSSH